jgi:predicted nucleic acid-binding protein
MRAAYVDTSILVALAFAEPGSPALRRKLRAVDALFSATLLESEMLATAAREGAIEPARRLLGLVRFVYSARRLTAEAHAALAHGVLRGADLHHIATALFLFPQPQEGFFLTLDGRQAEVAAKLGFRTAADL